MLAAVLVLASLACAGQARRLRTPVGRWEGDLYGNGQEVLRIGNRGDLKGLSELLCKLLTFNPAAAFYPPNPGLSPGFSNFPFAHKPARLRRQASAMSSQGLKLKSLDEVLAAMGTSQHTKVKFAAPLKKVKVAHPINDLLGAAVGKSIKRARFELVPENGWHRYVVHFSCDISNLIKWRGERPIPQTSNPSWLLPTKDDLAVRMAQMQVEIRQAGWKVLTCDPDIVAMLCNKSSLRDHAEKIRMLDNMPMHWSSPEDANYPCILKAVTGDHGKGTYIVNSIEEVFKFTRDGFGSRWLLQELITGRNEFSTSLLVVEGEILDAICTEYVYDSHQYVWPRCRLISQTTHDRVPAQHLHVMSSFLNDYSGICNFNYKLRNGQMVIFEVNPRVGGDLTCDVPPERACKLFEKLDRLSL